MVTINGLFEQKQKEMLVSLSGVHATSTHPPTIGTLSENDWLRMLKAYMPKRYCVDSAYIIDIDDNVSDQIDIVIFDQHYSPFIFKKDGAQYISAESVYAVFEVKQTINKENIEYAEGKIASVRKLRRTTAKIPHAGGQYSPKPLHTIIGGILATNSDWNPSFGEPFATLVKASEEKGRLSMGCVINEGSFETYFGETETITTFPKEKALISFFLNLLVQLQKIGTVPAIDFEEYLKVIM